MHTSILLVALTTMPAAEPAKLTWRTDYGQAQRQGKSLGKPLAVFLAPGKDGWGKVTKEGKLSDKALAALAEGYVAVHIDTDTEAGKKWTNAFSLASGLGVVFSDRSGEIQAFRNEGSLDGDSLTTRLEQFSGTATIRVSNYVEPGTRTVIEPSIQGRIEYGYSPRGGRACSS